MNYCFILPFFIIKHLRYSFLQVNAELGACILKKSSKLHILFYFDLLISFEFYCSTDNFTESLLEIHEKELKEVQDYYKEHKAILEKIDLREKFFKEMVVFDVSVFQLDTFPF